MKNALFNIVLMRIKTILFNYIIQYFIYHYMLTVIKISWDAKNTENSLGRQRVNRCRIIEKDLHFFFLNNLL